MFIDVGRVPKNKVPDDIKLLVNIEDNEVEFKVHCHWCNRIIRGVTSPPVMFGVGRALAMQMHAFHDAHAMFVEHVDAMHKPKTIRTKAAR